MTEKILHLEDIITAMMEHQKKRGCCRWSVMFSEEDGEIVLAALKVYRRKWEESIEKEKKDAKPGTT